MEGWVCYAIVLIWFARYISNDTYGVLNMAQAGATREKVFEAADQLLEQGVRPTQQNIRERIGSGSLTTINKALNDWWRTLGERITRQNQHPELPEAVLHVANQLWDRALAYAEHRFDEQRQALAQQEVSLRDQMARSVQGDKESLGELQAQNSRLLAKCEQLADEKHGLEQKLLKLDEQVYRLNTQLDESARELRQMQRLGAGGQGGEALVEARVRLSIQDEELNRLRDLNDRLNRENAALKQRLEAVAHNQ